MRRLLLAAVLAAAVTLTARAAGGTDAPAARDYDQEIRAAFAAKDLARAEAVASEGIAARPSDPGLWSKRGIVRAAQGRLAEAEADFRRSIEIRDNATARANLGKLEMQLKRYADGLADLRRAVELDPKHARAWARLADAEMIAAHPEEGLRAVSEAIRLDPDDPEVQEIGLRIMRFLNLPSILRPKEALEHHARGGELAGAGKWREAMVEYEAALKLDSTFADCHYNLGVAASELGDLERAEREYVLAIGKYDRNERLLKADAMNNLVYTHVRRGKATTEDVELQREAIAMSRETPAKLDTLARACDAIGDRACALEAFGKLAAAEEEMPSDVRRYAKERVEALKR